MTLNDSVQTLLANVYKFKINVERNFKTLTFYSNDILLFKSNWTVNLKVIKNTAFG